MCDREMKKKCLAINQYASETKNLDGASEAFLEETAPLIGYVVHRFNTLEELLNSAICGLFHDDCDSVGLLVLYRMNYAAKLDLFKRFLEYEQACLGKRMPSFDKIAGALSQAGRLRNIVVHADWESADDKGYALCKLRLTTKALEHEYVQFSPEGLEKILQLLDETCDMFETYEDEHRQLLYE